MNTKIIIASMLIVLFVFSVFSCTGFHEVYASKKGTHESAVTKHKISESLKKYHATGLTKKQRHEK